jgi:hypothetical protein
LLNDPERQGLVSDSSLARKMLLESCSGCKI